MIGPGRTRLTIIASFGSLRPVSRSMTPNALEIQRHLFRGAKSFGDVRGITRSEFWETDPDECGLQCSTRRE